MVRGADAALRVTASLIDMLLAAVLTVLLRNTTGIYFAERSVETFRIGSPDTIWNAP